MLEFLLETCVDVSRHKKAAGQFCGQAVSKNDGFFRKGSLVLATCAADSLKGLALLENQAGQGRGNGWKEGVFSLLKCQCQESQQSHPLIRCAPPPPSV